MSELLIRFVLYWS